MRAAWRATSLHARACRLSTDAALPSAAPSATCRQDVLAIVSERAQCDEQAATNVSLESDLKLKFEVRAHSALVSAGVSVRVRSDPRTLPARPLASHRRCSRAASVDSA